MRTSCVIIHDLYLALSSVMIIKKKILVALTLYSHITHPNMKSTTIIFIKKYVFQIILWIYQFD